MAHLDNLSHEIYFILDECREKQSKKLDLNFKQITNSPDLTNYAWIETYDMSYNEIEELDSLPPNLLEFDARNNGLKTICTLPVTLVKLDLSGNQLTEFDGSSLIALTDLDISDNKMESVILPPNLQICRMDNNNLTEPPTIPDSVVDLDIASNRLQTFPIVGANIEKLDLCDNMIKAVPELHEGLTKLRISHNEICEITTKLPVSLIELAVMGCCLNLISIEHLVNLERVNLSDNLLNEVPALPPKLKYLDLSKNTLIEIPTEFPETLDSLDIRHNGITKIPDEVEKSKIILFYNGNPAYDNDEHGYTPFGGNGYRLGGASSSSGVGASRSYGFSTSSYHNQMINQVSTQWNGFYNRDKDPHHIILKHSVVV